MLLTLIFVLLLIFFLYTLVRQLKGASNTSLPIPFVKNGCLPIIGHLIPFLKDKSKFIFECQRSYGSRFFIELFSQRMIFLLDPNDWSPVIRNPNLSLPVKDFGTKTFGISRGFLDDEPIMNEIHRYFKLYLQSTESLDFLTARFSKCVRDVMIQDRARIGSHVWHPYSLLELSHRMIFEASGRTLFGDMNPLLLEKEFLLFDKKFHYFAAFLPDFIYSLFLRREMNARSSMTTYFNAHPHSNNESELVHHRAKRILEAESRQPNDLGASHTSIFWASVGNTIPATFWSLFYILRDPHALQKINEEICTHLPPFSFSDPNDKSFEFWTSGNIAKCVYLESAINEVLRIKGTPMVSRKCYQDTQISLADGTIIPVRENDMISLFPEVVHSDPNYFPEPEIYKFDRFLGKTTDAIKGLLTFGSGKTICPGRHFAKNEIKICTALILQNIDYEFLETNMNINCVKNRIGFGIAPPDCDVPIRYRYKE
ncbi:unnamed protein product [Rotaria magnacalcarata]|uniref:Cytochrome P450 n=1 Tax=Rotaria magnacalcarata TaxID=392030 RepID=A0A819HIE9_9BILA|nr:unnamed protein product [Rotaria magnacalcarata]CAF1670479.1 unnamed protein product [Rotaria magnacalcarata]CAF2034275.1 unnamed protein product [Rotaria magnacalcarata]CAF2228309.1 unnamed protein product [Rotaria magnacalcarata]CAF2231522.1 unnamed protein product [Rotaria magnacalcarata]